MKRLLFLLAFITASFTSFSQSEIAELHIGDMLDIDAVSIEFVELISDSRCPKYVSCIRAGEAEVLVAVYKNGKFSHEQTLTFFASGVVKQEAMQLFASDQLNIRGLNLLPYPEGQTKTPEDQYCLSIGIN